MAKAKTSQKQKKSTKNIATKTLIEYSPSAELLNEEFIGKAILECLKNNDPEGVMEVLSAYLDTVNKTNTAIKTEIPRSTLYYNLKNRNPTIKTLAKLIHSSRLEIKR